MKKHSIFLILFFFLANIPLHAIAEKDTIVLQKETFIYSIKGNDTLRLDKYTPSIAVFEKSPCVIFMFGGGFAAGKRNEYYYMPYFKFLTENGYTVISIDYRLGFKNLTIDENKKTTAKEFIAIFKNTINMAVEDLFDATNYTLEKAKQWNIDPALIMASGSSAGAISVLHGEYEISTGGELSRKLPQGFNYAGIISFAGAILSTNGNLKWSENTSPIQLFHGDADRNVPYDKIKIGKLGFFGSKNIAKRLDKANLPYYFYTESDVDHRIAITPVRKNQEEILSFLDDYIIQKQRVNTVVNVQMIDQPRVKKNFSIFDYLKANYAGE